MQQGDHSKYCKWWNSCIHNIYLSRKPWLAFALFIFPGSWINVRTPKTCCLYKGYSKNNCIQPFVKLSVTQTQEITNSITKGPDLLTCRKEEALLNTHILYTWGFSERVGKVNHNFLNAWVWLGILPNVAQKYLFSLAQLQWKRKHIFGSQI